MRPLSPKEDIVMRNHTHSAANPFGFRCPACGDGSHLDIQAHVWVHLTEDGTDPDAAHDASHHWDEASVYLCTRYAALGRVRDLHGRGAS